MLRLNAAAVSIFAKYEFIRQILHYTIVRALNLGGLVLENAGISANDQITGNCSALVQESDLADRRDRGQLVNCGVQLSHLVLTSCNETRLTNAQVVMDTPSTGLQP
jgi:hypothetical protein